MPNSIQVNILCDVLFLVLLLWLLFQKLNECQSVFFFLNFISFGILCVTGVYLAFFVIWFDQFSFFSLYRCYLRAFSLSLAFFDRFLIKRFMKFELIHSLVWTTQAEIPSKNCRNKLTNYKMNFYGKEKLVTFTYFNNKCKRIPRRKKNQSTEHNLHIV